MEEKKTKPILLLQWLKPGEYREVRKALGEFAATVNIESADVQKKAKAQAAFAKWVKENSENLQYPFIGGHGVLGEGGKVIGIGASADPDEHATWEEIWEMLSAGNISGGLWLGGCRTGDAAAALSPIMAASHRTVINYIVGFDESIYPAEIEDVLRQLLKNTDTKKIVYLDEELDLIRKTVPGTAVVMYYRARTKAGKTEFVNVDEFEEKVGMTFHDFLKQGG